MPTRGNLDGYRKLHSPVPLIVISSMLILTLQWLTLTKIIPVFSAPFGNESDIGRITFLTYLSIYAAVWATYFASGIDYKRLFPGDSENTILGRCVSYLVRTRTLRSLLHHTSKQWDDDSRLVERDLESRDQQYREKARSATSNLGMLLTVSALELAQINLTYSRLEEPIAIWTKSALGAATIVSIAAFVMFIMATDSLDTLFNQSRTSGDQHVLVKHFYKRSVTPRYFGLALLMLSAALIIGNREPFLGAACFGIVISIGFSHWFPTVPDPEREPQIRYQAASLCFKGACRAVLVFTPLILWFCVA